MGQTIHTSSDRKSLNWTNTKTIFPRPACIIFPAYLMLAYSLAPLFVDYIHYPQSECLLKKDVLCCSNRNQVRTSPLRSLVIVLNRSVTGEKLDFLKEEFFTLAKEGPTFSGVITEDQEALAGHGTDLLKSVLSFPYFHSLLFLAFCLSFLFVILYRVPCFSPKP